MNADQQVPEFRADMTLQDLTSMVEVSYRVKLESLDGRYFDTVAPEFDQLLASAQLRK